MATFDRSRSGIQNAAIFEGLSPEELNLVVSHFSSVKGEAASEMFLLESGRVRLHEINVDGRELLIRIVRPGEVFGDKAAIAGADYRASAERDTQQFEGHWKAAI